MLFQKGSFCVILVGSIYYTVSRTLATSLSAQCIDIYQLNYLGAGLVYLPSGIAGMISSYITGKSALLLISQFCHRVTLLGRLLDRDYRYMAKKCGREVSVRAGDDITTFPIEQARLRSIWYLIIVSGSATAGYGWALQVKTVRKIPLIRSC